MEGSKPECHSGARVLASVSASQIAGVRVIRGCVNVCVGLGASGVGKSRDKFHHWARARETLGIYLGNFNLENQRDCECD